MMIMMMLNPINVEARHQYRRILSSDDTPDYKTQTNNYSDDDEKRESPLAAPVSSSR
jgi:hypothetical protein